ncbi:MAG: hypothetical protein OFPI_20360 [Osedax symbiont Rs2]|nr:MAG: hypothetical protein OFPI_20360 [Osedax symbiont Rs2]
MGNGSVETVVTVIVVLLINGCGNKLESKSEKIIVPLTAEQQLVRKAKQMQCPECLG